MTTIEVFTIEFSIQKDYINLTYQGSDTFLKKKFITMDNTKHVQESN